MSLAHYLLRNLLHRKFLSLLTVLSVAATVAFIVLLSLSKAGVEQGAEKGYGPFDIVIGAQGSESQLVLNTFYHVGAPNGNIPGDTLEIVQNHPGVDRAFALTTGDRYGEFPIVGVDPEYFLIRYGDRKMTEGSLYGRTGEVVIGAYAAKMLDLKIGDTFTGSHGLMEDLHLDEGEEEEEEHDAHHSFAYKVAGILPGLNTADDRAIFTTVDYAWAVHGQPADQGEITAIVVKPSGLQAGQELRNLFREEGRVLVAYSSKAVADVVNLVDKGTELLGVVTTLCILLAAVTVLLSMVAAAGERTKDAGLLRLLGKSKTYILTVMLGEGLVLTGAGVILGFLAGHAGGYLLQDTLFRYAGIRIDPFLISGDHALLAAGALAIGLAASLLPAFRLYRMNPLALFKG